MLHRLGATDIWYRSLSLAPTARVSYAFSPRPYPSDPVSEERWLAYVRSLRPDPYNPRQLLFPRDPDVPNDRAVTFSVLALDRSGSLLRRDRPDRRATGEEVHRFRSRILGDARTVWLTTVAPPAARRRAPNLVVVFDGLTYLRTLSAPSTVARLVASGRLGPTALVFVGTGRKGRVAELHLSAPFARFVARELLPWVSRRLRWNFRPARTVLVGSSLGGLMAAFAAYRYPESFGGVLAQSGAFLVGRPGRESDEEWLTQEYARLPRRSTRFYLDVGRYETFAVPRIGLSLRASVRHFRDVLRARGYDVTFREFEGGHDYACWRETLGPGLERLLTPGSRAG